jgi:hypothetical protein
VTPTRRSVLAALLALSAALVWSLLRIADAESSAVPAVPWSVTLAITAFSGAVAVSAVALRRRLRGEPGTRPPDPIAAARMAALAKATSHAGALLVGAYAGLTVYLILGDESPLRRERALLAGAAALAAVALVAAGLFLEKVCRVQPPTSRRPRPEKTSWAAQPSRRTRRLGERDHSRRGRVPLLRGDAVAQPLAARLSADR